MSLVFPRHSFVQAQPVYDPDAPHPCYDDPALCMPVSTPVNLAFQVVAGDGILIADVLEYTDSFYAYAVPPGTDCRTDVQVTGTFESHPVFIKTTSVYFDLPAGLIGGLFDNATGNDSFQAYPCEIGECFKLQLVFELRDKSTNAVHKRYYFGCTNCFVRIPINDCFTTLIQYRDNENSFDFLYTGGGRDNYYNKTELPMYMRDPVLNDDTKVYTRSDGSIVKLYERKEEQYILETDLMPYPWLKALDVALSHDHVYVFNPNALSFDIYNPELVISVQKKDNFEIEYQKGSFTAFGKGTCKLLNAAPVHLYNNNCS